MPPPQRTAGAPHGGGASRTGVNGTNREVLTVRSDLCYRVVGIIADGPRHSADRLLTNWGTTCDNVACSRSPCLLALAAAAGSRAIATADQLIDGGPVTPDLGSVHEAVPGGPCTTDTPYEQHIYGAVSRYEDLGCKRIEFSLGPITVKPGQNEALVVPTTIESPRYDGYIVRFKPDLQIAVNGNKTRTDVMHLHHATWLNLGASYGDGPFFAAGEEKTIATFPEGYGMKVKGTDEWGLLYMVHNATTEVEEVWISYEIDYVPAAAAEANPDADGPRTANLLPVKPLWFDVQKHKIHDDAPSTGSNPVFHVAARLRHRRRRDGPPGLPLARPELLPLRPVRRGHPPDGRRRRRADRRA